MSKTSVVFVAVLCSIERRLLLGVVVRCRRRRRRRRRRRCRRRC